MVKQTTPWATRMDNAAAQLGITAAALEQIVVDKLDKIDIVELDDDSFQLEDFKRGFKDAPGMALRKAFDALHQAQ